VSLIWHVPYIDRIVVDHKERELHRLCYRMVNDGTDHPMLTLSNGEQNQSTADFELNTFLAEHIPLATSNQNERTTDRIGVMLEKMNETDQRILHLMNYYEKQ
jgi:hypothetical protein